jgi:hypothetical protein
MSVDGPLKILLRRFPDKPARLHLQRWKPDHPVTIAFDVAELDEIAAAIAVAREQIAVAPNSASPNSVLDLGAMVKLDRQGAQ